MRALRAFSTAFAIVFLVVGFFGYKQGYQLVNSPDAVERLAFDRISVAREDNKYFFVFLIDGQIVYRFDPDNDKLEVGGGAFSGELSRNFPSWQTFVLTDPTVSGFLGTVFAGYTLKDFLTKPSLLRDVLAKDGVTRRWQVLGMILGSGSGYWIGYSAATRNLPTSDSIEFRSVLDDKEHWIKKKRAMLFRVASNIQRDISKIKDTKSRDLELASYKFALSNRGPSDKMSEFLRTSRETSDRVVGIEKLEEYPEALWQRLVVAITVVLVATVALGLILSLYLLVRKLWDRQTLRFPDIG